MSTGRPTDVLLWRARLDPGHPPPRRVSLPEGLFASRVAWNASQALLYVYAPLPRQQELTREDAERLRSACFADGRAPIAAETCRLQNILALAGASAAESPNHHYVVETDADPGWMEEIDRWYEEEHLPGLAGVPGCLRASRFVNHDSGPHSLACYDLTRPEVLESAAWLAVRGTEWSGRTRPHFRNTRRTMFEILSGSTHESHEAVPRLTA